MFKAARWRSEKNNKISAVFKLRFHATQVSQFGGSTLVLSIIPADTGRPTAKLESAAKDGCCYWDIPVYESVKLHQDIKSGKIHDRIYYFIISNVSTKSAIVGEVSVNISDYTEATKPSSVSFPFKISDSEAVLHVSIQRVHENANQRDIIEQHDINRVKPEDRSLKRYFSNGDAEDGLNTNTTEEEPLRKTASVVAGLTSDRRASSGSDLTLSSSDSSSGLNTPRNNGVRSNDFNQHSLPQKPPTMNGSVYHDQYRPGWEWSPAPVHDSSNDGSVNSLADGLPGRESKLDSEDSVQKLKSDLVAMERRAEVSELELQTLRKQVVKEGKKGQDLLKEVASLKGERDAFKKECEQLKASQRRAEDWKVKNKLNFDGDPWSLLEEIKQEMDYEKDMNVNLRLQLQKTQDSNTELILAVQDLELMLDQRNKGTYDASDKPAAGDNASEPGKRVARCESDDDEEQKALEELVKQHTDTNKSYILEQKIMDLCSEMEMYRRDKDELEMQMEQLALDYEILKQENHDMSNKLDQSQLQEQLKLQYECSGTYGAFHELETQIDNLENELRIRSQEFSESLTTIKQLEKHIHRLESELRGRSKEYSDSVVNIKELESHVNNLEDEMVKQMQGFEADLEAVTRDKVQQEQRSIKAEEALRVTKWKNAKTAEKLQEEFKRLSLQMQSTFEANEKLATSALTEASELRLMTSHLEGLLQHANEELQSIKADYEVKLRELHTRIDLKSVQIDQMTKEIDEKTRQLDNQRKHQNEVSHTLSEEQLQLKANIERLTAEKNSLYKQIKQGERLKTDVEVMRQAIREREQMLESANAEMDDLDCTVALLKLEAEKSLQELNALKLLKKEEDTAHTNLQSEVEVLKVEYDELKNSLHQDELEKEKLRKQVAQLKSDLKKREDALTIMERKFKDNNDRTAVADKKKAASRNAKPETVPCGAKEVSTMRERIKLLEEQIKEKETSLGTSASAFLEKEQSLRNKIQELENKLQELNQPSTSSSNDEPEAADHGEQGSKIMESGNSATNSNGEKASTYEHEMDTMLKEMTLLKKRNSTMETELKDMQERYSEISLKFAEVEGDRQQLVMTLRNLKNSMKC